MLKNVGQFKDPEGVFVRGLDYYSGDGSTQEKPRIVTQLSQAAEDVMLEVANDRDRVLMDFELDERLGERRIVAEIKQRLPAPARRLECSPRLLVPLTEVLRLYSDSGDDEFSPLSGFDGLEGILQADLVDMRINRMTASLLADELDGAFAYAFTDHMVKHL